MYGEETLTTDTLHKQNIWISNDWQGTYSYSSRSLDASLADKSHRALSKSATKLELIMTDLQKSANNQLITMNCEQVR